MFLLETALVYNTALRDRREVPLDVIPFPWMNRYGAMQFVFDQAGSRIIAIHSSPGRSMMLRPCTAFTIPVYPLVIHQKCHVTVTPLSSLVISLKPIKVTSYRRRVPQRTQTSCLITLVPPSLSCLRPRTEQTSTAPPKCPLAPWPTTPMARLAFQTHNMSLQSARCSMS